MSPVVHIVDDDDAVRRSLGLMLTASGHAVRTYGSARDFLSERGLRAPGCAIIDIRMPDMDGLTLQQAMLDEGDPTPVIVVTGHAEIGLAVQAMKAGAVDFIEKPYSEVDLLRAVATALARVEDARHQRAATEQATTRIANLTARERDVLRLLIEGSPNKVIAHELSISPRTVEIHRSHLMDKLDCRNLAQAVRLALTAGFEV